MNVEHGLDRTSSRELKMLDTDDVKLQLQREPSRRKSQQL